MINTRPNSITQLTESVQFFYAQSNKKKRKKKRKEQRSPNSISISIESNFTLRLLSVSSMAIEPVLKTSDASAPLILTSGASGRVNALFSVQALKSFAMLVTSLVLLLLVPFRRRKRVNPIALSAEKPKDEKQESGSGSGGGGNGQRKGAVVRFPATFVPWRRAAAAAVAADHETAARRAMAIRRVVQDDGDEDRVVREFSLFVTSRGDSIFTQSWTPVSIPIRGLVVLLHGLNEHSGRYNDFAKQLNANGYKVYGMDWIGVEYSIAAKEGKNNIEAPLLRHGGSDGLHAYVHSLDDAVADTKTFLEKVLAENPGFPCFCFGHSTGAAIVLKAVLDPKVEARVAGVILTSPAVGVQPSHPIFAVLAPVFSFLLPKYQLSAANKKGMPVSRDPEALVAKYSDPLVYTGSIRIRTGYEILRITSYLQRNLRRLRVPFLVLHGTADTVTDPEASQKLYKEASSTDKTIKLFEGFLHDLLFEPEREDIVKDIIEWLNCRVKG